MARGSAPSPVSAPATRMRAGSRGRASVKSSLIDGGGTVFVRRAEKTWDVKFQSRPRSWLQYQSNFLYAF